jgi:WD40 repeat protein
VKIWETRSGQELLNLEGDSLDVRALAFNPDGSRLAAGGMHQIRIWSATHR